jgi:glycosyltransferase involved in cell wall biosynthesis
LGRIVGDTGNVVPPKDSPALAQNWHALLENSPQDKTQLERTARRRIEEHFNLPAIVVQYEKLYVEIATCTT